MGTKPSGQCSIKLTLQIEPLLLIFFIRFKFKLFFNKKKIPKKWCSFLYKGEKTTLRLIFLLEIDTLVGMWAYGISSISQGE